MVAKKDALLLFPDQLCENHPLIDKSTIIFLLEDDYFFSKFMFHKKKLIFHRASMKAFGQKLSQQGHTVIYFEFPTVRDEQHGLFAYLKKHSIQNCNYLAPGDTHLEKELIKTAHRKNIKLTRHDSPIFLGTSQDIKKYFDNKKHYSMANFYIEQRKRYTILIDHHKPRGGSWSFDTENRKKFPKGFQQPTYWQPQETDYIIQARKEITQAFPDNPGNDKNFIFPVTHADAKKWFNDFLQHRLADFGPYQDAISKNVPFGYHSLLSPLINSGLLTPDYILTTTLDYAEKHKTPLNSLEGFIRQILGWREFINGVYQTEGDYIRKQNFFNHKEKLPASFWTATTGIQPVDDAIGHTLENSYAHHIERLMILGNFMLLTEINPDDVYSWFMQMYIDAYDWVMVPNVYSMSQYADGGLITTKPYISGSNYILKMSDYKKGPWCSVWDGLYWRFIYKNINTISKNPRLGAMKIYLARMEKDTLKKHIVTAENYLKNFY